MSTADVDAQPNWNLRMNKKKPRITKEDMRTVLLLHRCGFSHAYIGTIIGITRKQVDIRVTNALAAEEAGMLG